MKTRIKRLVCVLLCLTLLLTVGAMPRAQASELDDLKKQAELLEKKIAELQKSIKANSENKKDQEATLRALNAQLAALDEQIRILKSRVSLLNGEISALDKDINALDTEIAELNARIEAAQEEKAQKQQEIAATTALMLDRMRAAYLAGSASELDILLSSADLAAFLTRSELLRRVAEEDQLLIDTLEKHSADLDALEAELEAARTGVETKKAAVDEARKSAAEKKRDADASLADLNSKQNQIESKSSNIVSVINSLDRNSKAWKDQIAKYEREQKQAERAIEEYIRKNASGTGDTKPPENDGAMTWPVPYNNTYVSSNYGYRSDPFSGRQSFHGGIDICVSGGSQGKRIVAAQGGKVIFAGWHNSYGNYMIVDHGGGLSTLYAHCSSFAVSNGATVNKGDTIAYIGSTGNVTGPHLHFEVRVNSGSGDSRVNPLNYVSKP